MTGLEVFVVIALPVLLVLKMLQKPRPSKFRQGLWAYSVRKRGLSMDEALREAYVLGYVDTPPEGCLCRMGPQPPDEPSCRLHAGGLR